MKEEIKQEALEQVEYDVLFGFDTEEEIVEGIVDMFYDEDDFDGNWLRGEVQARMKEHREASKNWKTPTDFDRLAKAFDHLISQRIVCLHKAGYTRQDGEGDCMEVVHELKRKGINALGYTFYHTQDLQRAIDPGQANLLLGFDSPTQNDTEALQVGNMICAALRENGFKVEWTGTVDQRIMITNLNWQKVPDGQDWGSARVMRLMK